MTTKAETASLREPASMVENAERAIRASAREISFAILYLVLVSVLLLWVIAGVLAPLGAFFASGTP